MSANPRMRPRPRVAPPSPSHPPAPWPAGMEQALEAQRELLSLVQQCTGAPPIRRPTFGAVGRRLRSIQKRVARAGLATVTPRG